MLCGGLDNCKNYGVVSLKKGMTSTMKSCSGRVRMGPGMSIDSENRRSTWTERWQRKANRSSSPTTVYLMKLASGWNIFGRIIGMRLGNGLRRNASKSWYTGLTEVEALRKLSRHSIGGVMGVGLAFSALAVWGGVASHRRDNDVDLGPFPLQFGATSWRPSRFFGC